MKERENIQRIDFVRLVTLLTPTMMRSKVLMNIVRALVQPLVALNERRANERSDRLFWLRTTGQRRQLRYALNRWFGVEGFEIEDATQKGKWLMVYNEESPNYPTMLEDTTLLYSEKTVVGEHAFVVRYPKELKGREAEIRHIVSAYKVAGKDYNVYLYYVFVYNFATFVKKKHLWQNNVSPSCFVESLHLNNHLNRKKICSCK